MVSGFSLEIAMLTLKIDELTLRKYASDVKDLVENISYLNSSMSDLHVSEEELSGLMLNSNRKKVYYNSVLITVAIFIEKYIEAFEYYFVLLKPEVKRRPKSFENNKSLCERFELYTSKNYGENSLFVTSDWNKLKAIYLIRNSIVHNNGKLKENNKELLNELFPDYYQKNQFNGEFDTIIINGKFLDDAISYFNNFFKSYYLFLKNDVINYTNSLTSKPHTL